MPNEKTSSQTSTVDLISRHAHSILQTKLQKLVDDFATGSINRLQFHSLYERYQRQISALLDLTTQPGGAATDQNSDTEDTIALKRRLMARVLGLSVYSNANGLPIETLGNFTVDPALLIPMLSSYRSVTAEVFQAGIRSTVMENDQHLCFVPGRLTTLVALFSNEPSTDQLATAERMHRDFERANATALAHGSVDPSTLAYPFLAFVQRASRK